MTPVVPDASDASDASDGHGAGADAAPRDLDASAGEKGSVRSDRRHACPGCGYVFDETEGDVGQGFPAGTAWADVPDDWCCPDCGVREKPDFVAAAGP